MQIFGSDVDEHLWRKPVSVKTFLVISLKDMCHFMVPENILNSNASILLIKRLPYIMNTSIFTGDKSDLCCKILFLLAMRSRYVRQC